MDDKIEQIVRTMHYLWYEHDIFDDKMALLSFHSQLSKLFNLAGITETLCENNLEEMSPTKLRKIWNQ